MKKLMALLFSSVLILPLLFSSSFAQSSKQEIQELKEQVKELQKKIEQLENYGAQTNQRIDHVEEKAEEKKEGWWDDIQVEYTKPGGGLTFLSDYAKVRSRFRIQTQLSVNDTDGENTVTDFDLRRVRLKFDGWAFKPWFEYEIQIGAADDLTLRDALFQVSYYPEFKPTVGQYKVPFQREELNSSSELQLVERSIVNDEFSVGRDVGASIYGDFADFVTYGVGIFNGDGRNGNSTDSNLLYAGRVMFVPIGDELGIDPNFVGVKTGGPYLAIGGGAYVIPGLNIDRKTPDGDLDDRFDEIGIVVSDVYGATADINFQYSILSLEGEYDARWVEPDDLVAVDEVFDQGFRAQGGVFVLPKFVEVAGRFALIDYDEDVDGRDLRYEITPGLNFYLSESHKWKFQLSYSFIRNEDTADVEIDENIFRAQLQAYF